MPDFDFSELNSLAADLGEVAANAGPLIRSAVEVTSGRVKKDAREAVKSGASQWKALPGAIDYEVTVDAGLGGSSITSEIGYSKERPAGRLGNLREFGSPAKSLAPHNDLANALHANEADFERGLSKAAEDAEKKAGLG